MNNPENETKVRRFHINTVGHGPAERLDGEYVLHRDYAADTLLARQIIDDLRAKLATLEAEKDATRRDAERTQLQFIQATQQKQALEAEVQKLREALDAIDEQAETGIASERLGGNCVKEEFYKGQISVVRQLRAALNAGEKEGKP